LKFSSVFKKKSTAEKPLEKHLQTIVDPMEPLIVKAYPKRAGRPKILTDADVIRIMYWKAEKISNSEIGRRLHVSESTIRSYLKSLQRPSYQSVQSMAEKETEELNRGK